MLAKRSLRFDRARDDRPAGVGFGLAMKLVASIPELAREQAEALVQAAHQVCPYSNATRGNIVVICA
jgi:lipoyl-dependent peroxiredoxin